MLIQMSQKRNIPAISGLYMLVAQAVYAAEYFTNQKYSDTLIDEIYQDIKRKKENIVLVGMPSSGKTTIGKILAEEMVIAHMAKGGNRVIATGGGAILRQQNIDALRMNGKIIFLDRPLHLLQATSNRPLSSHKEQLQKLYEARYEKYRLAADIVIANQEDIERVIEQIQKEVYQ